MASFRTAFFFFFFFFFLSFCTKISSFRVASFVFSHDVLPSFRLFAWRLFTAKGRKDEMAQSSHHTLLSFFLFYSRSVKSVMNVYRACACLALLSVHLSRAQWSQTHGWGSAGNGNAVLDESPNDDSCETSESYQTLIKVLQMVIVLN